MCSYFGGWLASYQRLSPPTTLRVQSTEGGFSGCALPNQQLDETPAASNNQHRADDKLATRRHDSHNHIHRPRPEGRTEETGSRPSGLILSRLRLFLLALALEEVEHGSGPFIPHRSRTGDLAGTRRARARPTVRARAADAATSVCAAAGGVVRAGATRKHPRGIRGAGGKRVHGLQLPGTRSDGRFNHGVHQERSSGGRKPGPAHSSQSHRDSPEGVRQSRV